MASRKTASEDEKKVRCRKWTAELEQFIVVLSSEENCFAITLEKLALKKSSNNEVFMHVKKFFDAALKEKMFRKWNESKNFANKDGTIKKYEPLDTSIHKLRKKYANLKTGWRRISDRAKNGSGLAPKWYEHINEILAETNENLAAGSANLSYIIDVDVNAEKISENEMQDDEDACLSDEEHSHGEQKSLRRNMKIPEDRKNSDEFEEEKEEPKPRKKAMGKVVAATHQKRKIVRSQQQAFSHLANSVEQMVSSQMKKHRMSIGADLKRDEMFLQYKKDEAEKNRQHELKLAEIYAKAMVALASSNWLPHVGIPPSSTSCSFLARSHGTSNSNQTRDAIRNPAAPFDTSHQEGYYMRQHSDNSTQE